MCDPHETVHYYSCTSVVDYKLKIASAKNSTIYSIIEAFCNAAFLERPSEVHFKRVFEEKKHHSMPTMTEYDMMRRHLEIKQMDGNINLFVNYSSLVSISLT